MSGYQRQVIFLVVSDTDGVLPDGDRRRQHRCIGVEIQQLHAVGVQQGDDGNVVFGVNGDAPGTAPRLSDRDHRFSGLGLEIDDGDVVAPVVDNHRLLGDFVHRHHQGRNHRDGLSVPVQKGIAVPIQIQKDLGVGRGRFAQVDHVQRPGVPPHHQGLVGGRPHQRIDRKGPRRKEHLLRPPVLGSAHHQQYQETEEMLHEGISLDGSRAGKLRKSGPPRT